MNKPDPFLSDKAAVDVHELSILAMTAMKLIRRDHRVKIYKQTTHEAVKSARSFPNFD